MERICKTCYQRIFVTKSMESRGVRKYCSVACMGIGYTRGHHPYIKKATIVKNICKNCKNAFDVRKYELERGKGNFCSRSCRNKFYAKPITEIRRQKLKEYVKNRVITSKMRKIFSDAGKKGVKKMLTTKRKYTSIEELLYKFLENKRIFFEKQKVINDRFIVDAYVPSKNLIIEADGDYWHSLPKTMKKDKAENAYLKKCGYKLIRLSEREINKNSFTERLEVYLNG